MEKILVIGSAGQIGSELTIALRKQYGDSNVFATDIRKHRKISPREVLSRYSMYSMIKN